VELRPLYPRLPPPPTIPESIKGKSGTTATQPGNEPQQIKKPGGRVAPGSVTEVDRTSTSEVRGADTTQAALRAVPTNVFKLLGEVEDVNDCKIAVVAAQASTIPGGPAQPGRLPPAPH
jgi:hypothetical protein